ncbi:MAG: twin-arginine translocation signal domain-containing protein [Gemmatimonadetes bacterium]|nr:twin-arginine translocation signal domain-containing protein [Gemmatimonadota bacterium]
MSELSRRDLLKGAAIAGASVATAGLFNPADASAFPGIAESVAAGSAPDAVPAGLAARATMMGVPFERRDTVRFGVVGTGLRGRSVIGELLAIGDGVRITAVCDIVEEKARRAAKMITDKGHPEPAIIVAGERGFEQLARRDDVDFLYTATPWEWHVPVLLAGLNNGKHSAAECPVGTTLKELWSLVDASEKNRRHCIQLENCNYGYNEMMVNRMVHAGAFGEVLHAEAAYLHDLRRILFEDRDEGLWRRTWHTTRNANLYPTHGLGPVSWYMDIHKGDRFDYMVSMSTAERGLTLHREATVPDKSNAKWKERYITGDLNSSLIKTVKGKTILLQHDVSNPRPYSRLNNLQGTKGAFNDYPARFYVEGQAGGERWTNVDTYKAQYEHPLWTKVGELARTNGGHGGMDFVMAYRLVECIRQGLPPDFDVYDAAAWSAPLPISEQSVAKGSAPVKFPDFTRGEFARTAG